VPDTIQSGPNTVPAYMKPVPLKRRISYALLGLGLIGLGVLMYLKPGLFESMHPDDIIRNKTRLIARIVRWLWSRPAGVVSALLGLLCLWVAKDKIEDTRSLSEIMADDQKAA
jgi:hypothetical protein